MATVGAKAGKSPLAFAEELSRAERSRRMGVQTEGHDESSAEFMMESKRTDRPVFALKREWFAQIKRLAESVGKTPLVQLGWGDSREPDEEWVAAPRAFFQPWQEKLQPEVLICPMERASRSIRRSLVRMFRDDALGRGHHAFLEISMGGGEGTWVAIPLSSFQAMMRWRKK